MGPGDPFFGALFFPSDFFFGATAFTCAAGCLASGSVLGMMEPSQVSNDSVLFGAFLLFSGGATERRATAAPLGGRDRREEACPGTAECTALPVGRFLEGILAGGT